MKNLFRLLLLAAGFWSMCGSTATAQVPLVMNFQGRLIQDSNLVNGTVGLSLRLFAVPAGGTPLYEDSNSVIVVDGHYSTFLGDQTTAGSLTNALAATNVWIEVAVNGSALAPRERLVSAAYSMRAGLAETFTGAISDAQLSTNILLRLASNVWAAADSTTNYAKLRQGRMSPIYGAGTRVEDKGHGIVNWLDTAIDIRSTNVLHSVLRIYANNSTGMLAGTSIPGIDLWNYGVNHTGLYPAGTRTPSLNFGLHGAYSAPALWRIYGVARGTNDMCGDLLFTAQDQSASIFERARITYDGGIIASGTVTAASFIGDGSRLTCTQLVKKTGDTMSGRLNLPAGGLAVGGSQLVVTAAGNITSPRWQATVVCTNRPGPLPHFNTIASAGGTLMIFVSGSGYATAARTITMNVLFDDSPIGSVMVHATTPNNHCAFVPGQFIVRGIQAGLHSITLAPASGTATSSDDYFNISAIEFPF